MLAEHAWKRGPVCLSHHGPSVESAQSCDLGGAVWGETQHVLDRTGSFRLSKGRSSHARSCDVDPFDRGYGMESAWMSSYQMDDGSIFRPPDRKHGGLEFCRCALAVPVSRGGRRVAKLTSSNLE